MIDLFTGEEAKPKQADAQQMQLNLLKGEVFSSVKAERFRCYGCGKYVVTIEYTMCESCYDLHSDKLEQLKMEAM
jgi:hypothetical protein